MILVREVFQLKYGQGDALPQLFGEARQTFLRDTSARLLFDLSGQFFTAVVEIEMESLAAWERRIAELFSNPEATDWFARLVTTVESGRREFYTIAS
jgi:hypothetical protein